MNQEIEIKECGYNGENCDGCGERKNNWYICMWGSMQNDLYSEWESEGKNIPVYPKLNN